MCTLLLAMEKHIYELILKNYLSLLFAITEVDYVVPSAGVSGDQCFVFFFFAWAATSACS